MPLKAARAAQKLLGQRDSDGEVAAMATGPGNAPAAVARPRAAPVDGMWIAVIAGGVLLIAVWALVLFISRRANS